MRPEVIGFCIIARPVIGFEENVAMPEVRPHRPIGLILDMDGVLFDSEGLHADSWEQVLLPLGVTFEAEWFHRWIGVPDARMVEHFAAQLPGHAAADLLAAKRARYRALSESEMSLYPGVFDEILAVKATGAPVGVATGGSEVDAVRLMKHFGLYDHLDAFVYAEMVEHKKPAPDAYLLAAELLGIDPATCAVVEDSPNGLAAAISAGCRPFTVKSAIPAELLTAAERTFDTTAEAISHIRGLISAPE